MKKNITPFLFLKGLFTGSFAFVFIFLFLVHSAFAQSDPDEPDFAKLKMSKEEFMLRRAEAIGFRRGVEKDKPFDPTKRIEAIRQMESQKLALTSRPNAMYPNSVLSSWTELGPNPIPNGQVLSGSQMAVSGRTISIAVNPTDPNIVYVGTAQGGLYRSLNGGTTWVPLLDNALSLAVNTVAIAPSQPNTIFVGTGEAGFSADSYFGVGIYRIDNANSVSPTITGPIGGTNFTGRAVSKIVVHPTDPNIIFVSSASGLGGIGAASNTILASKGIFRSIDALSASPTFTKLTLTGPAAQDRSIVDMVMDPGNPDLILCTLADQLSLGEGGIYRSIDALSPSPTFVRTFAAGVGTSASRTELALNRSGAGAVTVYAASGFNGGTVQRSIDGGATFTQRIDNNFCGGQCFYDIAVAVDPINANLVYLGGTGATTTFTISTDGGATFTSSAGGLHTDSHVITVAPSLPSTIYFGSDGGIYKSVNSGTSWVSLNNNTFRATQFMSVAVHPIDPNFSIGGTQDNGTNFYKPDGTWTRADFGDGGYSLIDQNATNTINVDMYHTYFNSSTLQGYSTVSTTATATEGNWVFRGCNGSAGNGIPCGGAVLFYAPIEQGPGNPNTVYYGANILYRSSDKGLTHTAASQNLTNPISAIGISILNDNVRIVGQNNGGIFGTSTGSTTLTNLDPGNTVPNNFIARAVIDPGNITTAYVTLSAFGVTNIWKTTNLNSATPTWTSANSGIPAVPVNAFVVNPANSNNLFAGTDIGVYVSEDAGTSWIPLGTGLPVVAVFDMAIQAPSNVLRIATHGRGLWQIAIGDPVPFIIASEKTLVAEDCAPSNGVIDPGETVTVSLCLKNTGGLTTTNLVGTLLATGGVTAPGSPQNYGVVTAGGVDVCKNFTFTANNICGGTITVSLQLQDGATDLGIITYSFSTGTAGAVVTTSYTGPSVAIPDNTPAGVNIILPVSGVVGLLNDIDFRLDALAGCDATTGNTNASVTHTYNADLVFKLISPAGTTVTLISSRGGAGANFCTVLLNDDGGFPAASSIPATGGVNGTFKPESPLSAFDGENPNGNWTLNVSDIGAVDVGTLNRFSLLITGAVCCQAASCNVTGTGTTTPVSCLGGTNGTATITLTGAGSGAPGTYTLDAGTPQPYSANPFTITGLSGGNHTIVATVTAGGCVSNSILVNVAEPAVFGATFTKTNLSACNNTQDGSITVTATGGSGTYNYAWTGSTGSNNTPYPNPGNVSSISGLNYGYYNVTITDAAGCGSPVTYSNIHVEFAYYVYVTNSGSLSSSCGNTGSIILYGNAGLTPYTYSLNGTTYQAGNTFINLAAGSYTAYVKDAAGCVSTKSITIGSASPISVSPFARAATSCNNDGSIEIYRSGGIPGYTYSLDNVTYQAGNVFLNLAPGPYTAWVKDSKGCTGSQTITIGQGSGLTLSANKTNTSTCVNDGTIQVNASGGVSPYTYSIDGGTTYQPGNLFSGLTNVTYVISVKDFKGCLGSINVTINLNPIVVTYSATASGSCALSTGKIQLFRTGGVGPYTYSLDGNTYQPGNTFLNLSPGTYQGFVKDSKTCVGNVGGIVVGPSGCPPPPVTKNSKPAIQVLPNRPLTIQLYPNPSESEFTLILHGYNNIENVSIKVTDLLGRKVYQSESNARSNYKFGKEFLAGLYKVEVIQGLQKRSIKIVKE